MPEYKAPVRDIKFVMQELLDCDKHYKQLGYDDASEDMVDAIISEAAKFTEQVIAPLNQIGDEQGCTWTDGVVTTPDGFKDAYQQYVEGGWPTLSQSEEFGGQGLPYSLNASISEMMSSANHSFAMYPGLSHGAQATIEAHGTSEQKQQYMPKLVEGSWTGTMCLTESHCGTDLGMLRTKAILNDDGSYAITGTKIFISAGEHDLSENIVHIVIARLPGAPEGSKGISLFIVPKFNVNDDGTKADRNAVSCGSIEHKMGINANATCVINFDSAKGFLIGQENRGLHCMFTFMNAARLGVAMEGSAAAEAAFQGSLAYAKDRLQMRSISGVKNPDGPADPIIVHPDVRRMLLTQKSISEGGRALIGYLSQLVDITHASDDADVKADAENKLALLTPIAKAFLTELGFECTSHGVQVFGGHGFIKEWGMEQLLRDTKISCIYEGTTGIQALDLLARKILGSKGQILKPFMTDIAIFSKDNADNPAMSEYVSTLNSYAKQWQMITGDIGQKAMKNADEIGGASVDYLMFAGYVTLGYFWAKMASVAQSKLKDAGEDEAFYQAKIKTAAFYFHRILPRAQGHAACIEGGVDSMMALASEDFAF
ncbi:acyl-CoA dehydrogenase [Colwellia sp. PAMC 20917]|jgi:alkylation response protein AidB-like acyl-CoA dehydrogenase|uniref:acyl-CoA dehydrogenase C-terminal domain-containing protein n=1 Tax=unclassified Colwellia TaxID=196834 RepID=UPI000878361E|nr:MULTISPECIES: acyl-CoA dehydrogenase C-terminal domain-containing protein [unclassified Colwellia]MBA6363845.1 acyl-CoA dehydrogenase C-terminal domain-containing protein [Colwellia sp. BRX8-8]AOW78873.1 acyl-CoA dehydrogenase [Colwellia sp. PAMC 20917]MBA6350124.1 acyl-CoA dehydrogenase C-terminal domain-containing protein [Colwellia sp. BRX8-9]MBA6353899.1 acyl-CoA dehydrogenase C-terminal domain-containing protein [Colwellia sp. BRX9-1]MBA6356995.1 acyl-CoA dehydrogenase C-terminal domai